MSCIMLKILFLLTVLLKNCCHLKRVDNICSTEYIKKVFLKLGESGVLTAYNITVNRGVPSSISFYESCQIDIVTCPSCLISVTFEYINLNCLCGSVLNLYSYNPCRCDFVWITEPPYHNASGTSFCKLNSTNNFSSHSNSLGYRSKTRNVRISLFYNRPHINAFSLNYKSEQNRQFYFGTAHLLPELNQSSGFISSPFFPTTYPRDLIAEYIMTCIMPFNHMSLLNRQGAFSCRIILIFTDFQLASSSVIEFYDGNQRINIITGYSFRPPVIVTLTSTLRVRFLANNQNNLGFKALFSYVSGNNHKKLIEPITDCGGFVESVGGTIIMVNLVKTEVKFYDCIWLIKPFRNVFNLKSHLYLKITTFLNFAGEAELQVRRGLTSDSPMIETLRHPVSQNFKEHILPLKSGYYVRLRALFNPTSHLAIAYTSFSHNQCSTLSDFICQNYRCIPKKLSCDGFDHCGDNSDESSLCYQGWGSEPNMERWYTHRPNYYFPKTELYSDFKMATLVFSISVVALVFVLCILMFLFYQIKTRARQQRAFQDQLLSLSELYDGFSDEVFVEDVIIDDPPYYEPPPNYEDVIKSSKMKDITLKNI